MKRLDIFSFIMTKTQVLLLTYNGANTTQDVSKKTKNKGLAFSSCSMYKEVAVQVWVS